MAFRDRLREFRRFLGLTQEQVAERASLNYKHYQEIERGGKREVRLSTLVKIARGFDVPLYQLFTDAPASIVVAESSIVYRYETKPPARSVPATIHPVRKNPPPAP